MMSHCYRWTFEKILSPKYSRLIVVRVTCVVLMHIACPSLYTRTKTCPAQDILCVGRESWVGMATCYGWTVRESNPGEGEIFRTRSNRSWGPPSLLYNEYRVSFPGVKRPGLGVNHPPPSSAEVKERVDLYLCSPSEPSRPVPGWTFKCTVYLGYNGSL
jgi:hypothetical protein